MYVLQNYYDEFTGNINLDLAKRDISMLDKLIPFIASAAIPRKGENGKYLFSSVADRWMEMKVQEEETELSSGYGIEYLEFKPFLAYLKMLATESRSAYMDASQIANPSKSSAVPIVLWAYKREHGINYEDWDWTQIPYTMMPIFLGKGLNEILPYIHNCPTFDNLYELRKKAMISSKGTHLNTKSVYMGLTGNAEFDGLPKTVKRLLLQWWIWHPSVRVPDAMITDLNNLDNLAEEVEPSNIKNIVYHEMPWDLPTQRETRIQNDIPWLSAEPLGSFSITK